MALTDVAIRSAKRREKPYKLSDAAGPFVLLQPSGGKLWRLKYGIDRREKKLGLATLNDPDIMNLIARIQRGSAAGG
jgi:hypothetical protein